MSSLCLMLIKNSWLNSDLELALWHLYPLNLSTYSQLSCLLYSSILLTSSFLSSFSLLSSSAFSFLSCSLFPSAFYFLSRTSIINFSYWIMSPFCMMMTLKICISSLVSSGRVLEVKGKNMVYCLFLCIKRDIMCLNLQLLGHTIFTQLAVLLATNYLYLTLSTKGKTVLALRRISLS